MKWDNHNIVCGIKNGDQAAYKQLFLNYYSTICRFLFRIVNDFNAAEDVAQGIFMKVWLNRSNLDETKPIKNLLYVMAKKAALNLLRQKKSLNIADSDYRHLESGSYSDDYIIYKESFESVANCVSAMPEQRKKIFMMSRVEQLPNKEIAKLTNLSVRTVEKHLELALKDIKKTNIS